MKQTLLILCLFASCSSAPLRVPSGFDWTILPPLTEATTFAAGEELLSGFDPVDASAELREGDRVLYGLRVWDGTAVLTRFIRIRVVDTSVSITRHGHRQTLVMVRVEVFDESGDLAGGTDVRVDRDLFVYPSIVRGCRLRDAELQPGPFGGRPLHPSGEGDVPVSLFMGIIRRTDILLEILWKVVRKPSLLSMLGGVRVSGNSWCKQAVPATHALAQGDVFRIPYRIVLNRELALKATITATGNASPLAVCVGIVEFAGQATDDPSRRILFRLLAARRGDGGFP